LETIMNIDQLKQTLQTDEGIRFKPYVDTTGNTSIGIGRNLTAKGLSLAEIETLLDNDVAEACRNLDLNIPWWRQQTEARQQALANMCFNLGWGGLSEFKQMLSAMQVGDFNRAADAALASEWASQVGQRAVRISNLIRRG
jgi:lysozyme